MKIFYQRHTTDSDIIVVIKPYYLYVFIAALVVAMVNIEFPRTGLKTQRFKRALNRYTSL